MGRITSNVDEEVITRIDTLAAAEGLSRSEWIARAVIDRLARVIDSAALHALLTGIGYRTDSGTTFGSTTVASVKSFQSVAGLSASGHMERDLMRTYASGYWQTLVKLRLPAAAPFIFNALKINSTLALIGAIVAEFFGTPVVGMGFRISTEVGRMNVDMVWAEIAVAALAGSVFYGIVALIERAVTFWHPSVRGGA